MSVVEVVTIALASASAVLAAATLIYMVRRDAKSDLPGLMLHAERSTTDDLNCIIQVAVSENADWGLSEVRAVRPRGLLLRASPQDATARTFPIRPPARINPFKGVGGLRQFTATAPGGAFENMAVEVDCILVNREGKRVTVRARGYCA